MACFLLPASLLLSPLCCLRSFLALLYLTRIKQVLNLFHSLQPSTQLLLDICTSFVCITLILFKILGTFSNMLSVSIPEA